ncbi:GmrSD restriction endonuclease domain-containing protein [Modestobacter versicolor]|uniref:GmrSD restriction endonuclease domain-containing protein n=1 Tax=Modestobacter versicolor TaxID=429133 RepID=UPI0034E02D1A
MEQRSPRAAVLAVLAALALTGCQPAGPSGTAPGADAVSEAADRAPASAPAAGQAAVDVLATLPVKGRAAKTGYDRDRFGPQWADVDRNGCDTRNDVLARDLTDETFKPATRDCVVLTGTLADPYTGTTIAFVRGDGSSVDVDHVVALGNAWQTGAAGWDEARRTALANDPLNLLAVDYSANRQKGDGDAATWLPGNRAARCGYVARQVAVKATHGLWVTPAEHDAIAQVLADCPGEPVPAPTTAPPTPAGTGTPGAAQPYPDCAAARAAGAAPLHRGDPGWSDRMDGDGDGVACE